MAGRTTRNKIKFQLTSALKDLENAQVHLIGAAALGKGQSEWLENNLSDFVTSLELLVQMVTEFETRV